jgi:hypothetical protein
LSFLTSAVAKGVSKVYSRYKSKPKTSFNPDEALEVMEEIETTTKKDLSETEQENIISSMSSGAKKEDFVEALSEELKKAPAMKQIADTQDPAKIATLLKGKIAPEDIPLISKALNNINDPDQVARIIDEYDPVNINAKLVEDLALADTEKQVASILKGKASKETIEGIAPILKTLDDTETITKIMEDFDIKLKSATVPEIKAPKVETPEVKAVEPEVKAQEPDLTGVAPAKPMTKKEIDEFTKQNQVIPEEVANSEQMANILMEMEASEAGQRNFTGYGSDLEVSGTSSTFPSWVPDGLRRKKLFNQVNEHILNGTVPKGSSQKYLYDLIYERALREGALDTEKMNKILAGEGSKKIKKSATKQLEEDIKKNPKETPKETSKPTPQKEEYVKVKEALEKKTSRIAKIEGTGKERERGVARSLREKAVANGLESFDLPTYKQLETKKVQPKLAREFVDSVDEETALGVALGRVEPPKGLLPEAVFLDLEQKAILTGDSSLARKLALESSLVDEATEMGRRIQIWTLRNENSPVKAMHDILQARMKKKENKITRRKEKLVSDLDFKIQDAEFILKGLVC